MYKRPIISTLDNDAIMSLVLNRISFLKIETIAIADNTIIAMCGRIAKTSKLPTMKLSDAKFLDESA